MAAWKASSCAARGVWSEAGPSAARPGIALASLPRSGDDSRIRVRIGPIVLALVNVIRACIVTSCLLMTLAMGGDVLAVKTASSAIASRERGVCPALGIPLTKAAGLLAFFRCRERTMRPNARAINTCGVI